MNEYLVDESETFAGKVTGWSDDQVSILDLGRERLLGKAAWGIHPKNIYQGMAMGALLDPTIDLVILTGPAGCGKTLLALATALEQVVERGYSVADVAERLGICTKTVYQWRTSLSLGVGVNLTPTPDRNNTR